MQFGTVSPGRYTGADRYTGVAVGRRSTVLVNKAKYCQPNSLMPSLNIRSLPFLVFMGGFPSRLQNLSSGAIRPGGLLLGRYETNVCTNVDGWLNHPKGQF